MNNSDVCVLVTGVGGGSLGREIIKAFKMAPHNYKIVTTDASAKSVGLFETSHRYIVPEANSEKIDAELEINITELHEQVDEEHFSKTGISQRQLKQSFARRNQASRKKSKRK